MNFETVVLISVRPVQVFIAFEKYFIIRVKIVESIHNSLHVEKLPSASFDSYIQMNINMYKLFNFSISVFCKWFPRRIYSSQSKCTLCSSDALCMKSSEFKLIFLHENHHYQVFNSILTHLFVISNECRAQR